MSGIDPNYHFNVLSICRDAKLVAMKKTKVEEGELPFKKKSES